MIGWDATHAFHPENLNPGNASLITVWKLRPNEAEMSGLGYDTAAASGRLVLGAELDWGDGSLGF